MESMEFKYNGLIVGENIRRARKVAGMTTEELAEKLSKSVRHINKLELGWNKMSIDLLFDLMTVLHQDADTLLGVNKEEHEFSIDEKLSKMDPEVSIYLRKIFLEMIESFPKKEN